MLWLNSIWISRQNYLFLEKHILYFLHIDCLMQQEENLNVVRELFAEDDPQELLENGVLKAIAQIRRESNAPPGNPFPVITGTSAGAINAAALACRCANMDEAVRVLAEVWENFHADQIYRADSLGVIRTGARCVWAERSEVWKLTILNRGRREYVTARTLVNASGAWTRQVTETVLHLPTVQASFAKISQIVVRRIFDHDNVYVLQNDDRRMIYAIPFHRDFTLIGLSERGFEGDPATAAHRHQRDHHQHGRHTRHGGDVRPRPARTGRGRALGGRGRRVERLAEGDRLDRHHVPAVRARADGAAHS